MTEPKKTWRDVRATKPEPIVEVWIEKVIHAPGSQWKKQHFNIRLKQTGELIVTLSVSPLHDACRELVDRGTATGTLEAWYHEYEYPAAWLDIAGGARGVVVDSDKEGLMLKKWRPNAMAAKGGQ